MTDTLTPFFGEFLVSPAPLELSGNFCSHSCFYCFANLNNPKRTFDLKGTLAILRNHKKNKSLTAELLRRKYPTVISNHVDPFSKSNYKQMVPLMRIMTEMGLPIMVQTKGGHGVDEVLEFLPPSVWYISISHNDDATRKLIEPAAPNIESRFELCKKLKRHGHRVVVGINPCDRDWLPRPQELCEKLADIGVYGCWVEMLHFSSRMLRPMHQKHREAIGIEKCKEAKKKDIPQDVADHFLLTRGCVLQAGMELYSISQPNPSKFFEWSEYEHLFPTQQGFFNWLNENNKNLFGFQDWCDYFLPKLPPVAATGDICRHITSTTLLNEMPFKLPKKMTYQQVFAAAWKCDAISKASPVANAGCAKVFKDGQQLMRDGFPLFLYSPEGIPPQIELG